MLQKVVRYMQLPLCFKGSNTETLDIFAWAVQYSGNRCDPHTAVAQCEH